jgi:hypothetical protein
MNTERFTTVTYLLENGTKIVQPINKHSFVNEKGRKRTESELHKLFSDTAWDKRAVSFTIDSETNESLSTEKEIHFTKNERKVAKRDYKEFQKSNPNGFKQSLKSFQKQFVDSVTKCTRIRMNIGNVILQ